MPIPKCTMPFWKLLLHPFPWSVLPAGTPPSLGNRKGPWIYTAVSEQSCQLWLILSDSSHVAVLVLWRARCYMQTYFHFVSLPRKAIIQFSLGFSCRCLERQRCFFFLTFWQTIDPSPDVLYFICSTSDTYFNLMIFLPVRWELNVSHCAWKITFL